MFEIVQSNLLSVLIYFDDLIFGYSYYCSFEKKEFLCFNSILSGRLLISENKSSVRIENVMSLLSDDLIFWYPL